eukprot:COSAG01_NODE_30439_length_616_cov_0.673114_2_plen_58_part_01
MNGIRRWHTAIVDTLSVMSDIRILYQARILRHSAGLILWTWFTRAIERWVEPARRSSC